MCYSLYEFVLKLIAPSQLPRYSNIPVPLYRQHAGFTEEVNLLNKKSLATRILSDKREPFMRKLWAMRILRSI